MGYAWDGENSKGLINLGIDAAYDRSLQALKTLNFTINENEIIHIRTDRLIPYPIDTLVHFDINPQMVRFFNPRSEVAIKAEVTQ